MLVVSQSATEFNNLHSKIVTFLLDNTVAHQLKTHHSKLSTVYQSLVEVGYYIVDVFCTYRDTNIIICYSCRKLFFFTELLVRRTGRVYHQRLAVADVGQMTGQLDVVDELDADVGAALDAKAKNGAVASGHVLGGQDPREGSY